ncbi:esterase [Aspergillus campestris IBT 28561]|uniref:Esterase n=1 Tax=Aspergillus campestris (strain IBT 28561) TaxID=1392248 RepID=A0A2I1CZD4_ASPC2|nr:esterase [Aspergillus campestris IBT 28561]PKY02985.1 esterase [Aspergillus campestris IBT 28561]
MENLDRIVNDYTHPTTGSLHAAAFIAVDQSGNTIYSKAAGRAHPDDKDEVPMDSLYWIASMTKLVTAVAVVQLVEKGILSLDDDVRERLPELKDIQILRGMEHDASRGPARPKLDPVQGKLTLRQLLCHTSGLVYDSTSKLLRHWSQSQGRTAYTLSGSMAGYHHPLLFEPGTSWGYGGGLDWAGQLIERTTNSTLEDYTQSHIWSKLGAQSTTFHPERKTHLPALVPMKYRNGITSAPNAKRSLTLAQPAQHALGGIGLFSTPTDFSKLLVAILQSSTSSAPNDAVSQQGPIPTPQLLTKSGFDFLFGPQLDAQCRQAMPRPLGSQMRRVLNIKDINDAAQADHALGGTITLTDIPGRRRAGSMNWSGLPNMHWWIDPKSGIAAALFTQFMPPTDASVTDLLIELERALYSAIAVEAETEKKPSTSGVGDVSNMAKL